MTVLEQIQRVVGQMPEERQREVLDFAAFLNIRSAPANSRERGVKSRTRLSAAKQQRLDALMARHNDGRLPPAELAELDALVREAEEVMLANARGLAGRGC